MVMCIDAGDPLASPPRPPRFIEATSSPMRYMAAENAPDVMAKTDYVRQVGWPDAGKPKMRSGVVITTFADVIRRYVGDGGPGTTNEVRLVRPGAPAEKVQKAINWALSKLGEPYDNAFGQIDPRPAREYCS